MRVVWAVGVSVSFDVGPRGGNSPEVRSADLEEVTLNWFRVVDITFHPKAFPLPATDRLEERSTIMAPLRPLRQDEHDNECTGQVKCE